MNHMSVFYIIFSTIDILLLVLGDKLNKSQPIFACSQGIYMLPRNDKGAIYLLVDGLIFFLFSLNISHIFYKIPDQHGLVIKNIAAQGSIDNLRIDKLTFAKSTLPEGLTLSHYNHVPENAGMVVSEAINHLGKESE